jgi:hypothetical protein
MVDSLMMLHSKLHKHHNVLSYHCLHEAIASGVFSFHHLPGEINPANILSKHWSYQKLWHGMLEPLLSILATQQTSLMMRSSLFHLLNIWINEEQQNLHRIA